MVGQKWVGRVQGDKEGVVAVCRGHHVRTGVLAESP